MLYRRKDRNYIEAAYQLDIDFTDAHLAHTLTGLLGTAGSAWPWGTSPQVHLLVAIPSFILSWWLSNCNCHWTGPAGPNPHLGNWIWICTWRVKGGIWCSPNFQYWKENNFLAFRAAVPWIWSDIETLASTIYMYTYKTNDFIFLTECRFAANGEWMKRRREERRHNWHKKKYEYVALLLLLLRTAGPLISLFACYRFCCKLGASASSGGSLCYQLLLQLLACLVPRTENLPLVFVFCLTSNYRWVNWWNIVSWRLPLFAANPASIGAYLFGAWDWESASCVRAKSPLRLETASHNHKWVALAQSVSHVQFT